MAQRAARSSGERDYGGPLSDAPAFRLIDCAAPGSDAVPRPNGGRGILSGLSPAMRLAVYWLVGALGILLGSLVLASEVHAEQIRLTGSGGRVETVTTVRFTPSGGVAGEYVNSRELARILKGTATWDGSSRMLTITGDGKKAVFLVGSDRFVVSKPNAAQIAGRLRSAPVRHRGTTWLEKGSAQSFLRQFHAASFRSLPAALISRLPIRSDAGAETRATVAASSSATTSVSTPAPMRPAAGRTETAAVAAGSAGTQEAATGRRVAPFIRNIVIDAGHGDHDAGAIGPNGVREKDVNLDVALKLAAALGPRVGGRVTLTRRDDTFLSLKDRVAVAKRVRADLFISVHSNSSGGANRRRATGTEVYFFSTPSDDDARIAERLEGGPFDPNAEGIDPVLWDLMLAGNVVESHKLAEMVSKILPGAVGLPNRGVKSARFYVMYYGVMSNFPSILVELGYLSNPTEEAKLGSPEWRQAAANAIGSAVVQYLEDLERRYPEGRGWTR